ncbi:helix-turn-helix domain-containing protein [Rothia sp. P6271]|uniref:helix-turn-helix domain-containing protein n=1 Tax=Rothia sp. P6271 TaxID=3402659 RepID=UPI003AC00AD0
MNSLSHTLKEACQSLGYSTQEISKRAEKHGYKVSKATAHRYMTGKVPAKPNTEVLDAFAEVLGLDSHQLRLLAQLPPAGGEPFILPERAKDLTDSERAAVISVIDAILNSKTQAIKALNQNPRKSENTPTN